MAETDTALSASFRADLAAILVEVERSHAMANRVMALEAEVTTLRRAIAHLTEETK